MTLGSLLCWFFLATYLQAGTYGLTFMLPALFDTFGANERDVGEVLMATAISTLLTILLLGHITTRLGRMNAIIVSSILIALALFIFGSAGGLGPMLFVAGALLGIGWGIFYVLTPAILTEVTEAAQRIRIFTLLSVFMMAGFGLSPVFAAYLVEIGYSIALTFTVTAVLCLVSGGIFLMLKQPVRSHALAPQTTNVSDLTWSAVRVVMGSRAARPIIMIAFGASVFAAITNFQTVYAEQNGLDYALYFLAYTVTVIVCRVFFAGFVNTQAPYRLIGMLLVSMTASPICLYIAGSSPILYVIGAILFGIGYGIAYPIIKAMAANEAAEGYLDQTLQLFGLAYFVGIFGFPFIAGWLITSVGISAVLIVAALLAAIECALALSRHVADRA